MVAACSMGNRSTPRCCQGHSMGNHRSGRGGVAGESTAWAASGRAAGLVGERKGCRPGRHAGETPAWAALREDARPGPGSGETLAWAGRLGDVGLGVMARRCKDARMGGSRTGFWSLRGCWKLDWSG